MTNIRNRDRRAPPIAQGDMQPKALPENPDLLTIRQCLTHLHRQGVPLCGFTLRRRIADGSLKATKTTYRMLVHANDLARFIAKLKGT